MTFAWQRTLVAVENLIAGCVCNLCDETLNKPSVVGRCNHIFCHHCILKLCEGSKDTVCPECNEPFWMKDIHIDHQVESVLTLCQNFLPKLRRWKSESECKQNDTEETDNLSKSGNPEVSSCDININQLEIDDNGENSRSLEGLDNTLRSPTLDSYLDKLENVSQIFGPITTNDNKGNDNSDKLNASPFSCTISDDDIVSVSLCPNLKTTSFPDDSKNLAESIYTLENDPFNEADKCITSPIPSENPDDQSMNENPSTNLTSPPNSPEKSVEDSEAPLYHTPPDDPDSYVTAGNGSPLSIKNSPGGIDIISGKTIDLCQSDIPIIDLTSPNSVKKGLGMFDETSEDGIEEYDSSLKCTVSKLSDKANVLDLDSNKKDGFNTVDLPDTPKETCTQKSVHVKPVGKTYTRRCKRKLPTDSSNNNSLVETWLESVMDDNTANTVSSLPRYRLRSNRMISSETVTRDSFPNSPKTIHTSPIPTQRKSKRSRSSSLHSTDCNILKTPILKIQKSKRSRLSSLNSTDSSILKTPPLKVQKSSIKTTPNSGKRKSSKESTSKTPVTKKIPQNIESTPKTPDLITKKVAPKTPKSTPRNKRNQKGETPLHVAAIVGKVDTVRALLEDGADPSVQDNAGWTPLHETCLNKHVECAKLLIQFGAPVNARAGNHDTPLHDACAKNVAEIVRILLEKGACKTSKNMNGLTPMDFAASEEILQLLNGAISPDNLGILEKQDGAETGFIPVLLFSGLSNQEIAKYRNFPLEHRIVDTFSECVTHLVCGIDKRGFCKRTIKFFQAMAVGITLVSTSWLEKSRSKKSWEPASAHVVEGAVGFKAGSPKQSADDFLTDVPRLFTGLTFYVDRNLKCIPNRELIIELIQSCNGDIINREPKGQTAAKLIKVYHAKTDSYLQTVPTVIISNEKSNVSDITVHPHSWVLDCITNYQIIE